jgi:pentatricopeptide repeat protein
MEENGCTPDAVTYEILIRALSEDNKSDKAVKLLHEMISRDLLSFIRVKVGETLSSYNLFHSYRVSS